MNRYAEILKAQGKYVLEVDGVQWYDYQGFLMPAYLPHCVPDFSVETARKALRISRRPFIRWDEGFGSVEQTPWWYVLKRGPWGIETIKDKKKRWMIRKGEKNFHVRPLSLEEVLTLCPRVAEMAQNRYQGSADIETTEILKMRAESARKINDTLEYIGCFKDDILVSYSENYIQENAVWLAVIRHDPEYLRQYSSYALMNGLLEYYLNMRQMDYVLDGSRSIHHRTEFQDHLESVYGFTKQYAKVNVVYSPLFGGAVRVVFPFRKILFSIAAKQVIHFVDNVCAVMRQESIQRECKKK